MYYVLFVIIIVAMFCIMPRYSKAKEFDKFKEFEFAHRGLHHDKICENSLEAFKEAIKKGYGFEFDVQRTLDDKLVIMHDRTLKRACGIDRVISECFYDEIEDLTLFNTKSKLPTLDEVLKLVDGKVPLIVEIKQYDSNTRVCELVADKLDKYNGMFCVESFNPLAVNWFKKHRPEYVRGQLSEDYSTKKDTNKLLGFALQNLLTNVFTRPDFVAYNVEDKDNKLGLNIYKGVLKGKTVIWTIKDLETYKDCRREYDILIFENFLTKNAK